MPEQTPMAARNKPSLYTERFGPLVAGLLSFALLVYYRDQIVAHFVSGAWKPSDLYAAIFDWAAIQTGFAFGVYGFVAGRRDGFVGAVQGTIAMARFMTYIKRANIAGFLLTITSIPLIVLSPEIDQGWSTSFILVGMWFSLFIWAFCSFLRLAYNFGQLSSVKDQPFHGA